MRSHHRRVYNLAVTVTSSRTIPLDNQQHILLEGISWDFYEALLAQLEDRPVRVTYDAGDLEMMAPLPMHERWKKRIARLVETMSLECDVEIETLGSTTFRRADVAVGLEPDECYYVQSLPAVQGKKELDLMTDPPPDLAIEIDITRRSIPREPIYAALRVPELWRFDGRRLEVRVLEADQCYHPSQKSRAFPFLPMAQFAEFVLKLENEKQTNKLLREFRAWCRTLIGS